MLAKKKGPTDAVLRSQAAAQRERARVAALLARDHPEPASKRRGRQPAAIPVVAPTPEQMARYDYQQGMATNSSGQRLGRPYRRRPWFEGLVEREWAEAARTKRAPLFAVEHLKALRLYREAYEMSERSETQSCLASMMPRDGGTGEPSIAALSARSTVAWIERTLGALLPTMRAVAILDMSYAQAAMARFGSRNVDWYDDATGAFISKPAPRSGRHTERIRDEFHAGAKALAEAVGGWRAYDPITTAVAAQVVEDGPGSRPVSDAIDRAMADREGVEITGLLVSPSVADALLRENGGEALEGQELSAYRGIAVEIRDSWVWGWMVV